MLNQTRSPFAPKDDQKLMTELWDPALAEDLEAHVLFVYPWGKENTPLHDIKGPRTWQRDELQAMTEHIRNNKKRIEQKLEPLVYKSATGSGRGVGKSALVAWLTNWMMTSVLGSSTIVTANTEAQLRTKTWPEVGKWHTLLINSHWFEKTALSLRPAPWFEKALIHQLKIDTGYYFAQALTWSEENPDAFAGHHNTYGTLLMKDEASGIPQPIWDVAEGYFTEPVLHRYDLNFSNCRRNTGAFFECFHKNRKYYRRRNLDSRTVEGTDKTLLNQIVERHGEDSDVARIEVKGQFPRQGDKQFISRELVTEAQLRRLEKDPHAALIMGVDIARFGDDSTVIRFRQGRDARSIKPITLKGKDNVAVAAEVAEWIRKADPDAVCIDAGNGTGVIDILRDLGYKIHEVWFGSKSTKDEYGNKRTEMWADMREWLRGGCIDVHEDLETDLTAPEYHFAGASDIIMLESKEKLKGRGFASPDHGDALACTFAVKVARKDRATSRHNVGQAQRRRTVAQGVDYDLFS